MSRSQQHSHECRSRSLPRVRDLTVSSAAPSLLQDRKFIFAVVAVALLSAVCLEAQGAQPASGENHIVVIKQMHFDPTQMTVHAGDTVEWKNEDILSHTVTANDGSFDSGLID